MAIAADIFYHFIYHGYIEWKECYFCKKYGKPKIKE